MALHEASQNSVLAQPSSGDVAPDGTGMSSPPCTMILHVSNSWLGVIQSDPWLEPYRDALKHRFAKAQQWMKTINETEGGLEKFSRGYETFGFTFSADGDILYR